MGHDGFCHSQSNQFMSTRQQEKMERSGTGMDDGAGLPFSEK